MSEKSSYQVLPLNFSAMKALLDEGRVLRQKLEQEKNELSQNIDTLKKHMDVVSRLYSTKRINKELYDKITSVSSTFDSFNLQPNLKIISSHRKSQVDPKKRSKDLEKELEELESRITSLTQERSSLAVEEQRMKAQENSIFTDSTILREQCDDLLRQRDAIEHEQQEYAELLEFWKGKNEESSSVLSSSYNKLKSIQSIQDADAIRLMNEISSLYTTLDAASKKLRSHP